MANTVNFFDDLEFSTEKVMIKKMLETDMLKEIRICLSKDQIMKEHIAPAPIVVMVLDGEIMFNVDGESHTMKKGTAINLDSKVPHSLHAKENSVIRLSLSKFQ